MARRSCATSSLCSDLVRLALVLLASVLLAGPGAAQRLAVEGDVDHPAVEALRRIVADGDYVILSRDTLLTAGASIPGDLVVVGADVRLAGSVEGSVAVLGGALFLRPGGRVGGTVIAAQGAYLSSTLAQVGDTLSLPAEIGSTLERQDEVYTLRLTPAPERAFIEREGVFGFTPPTYDRVNGATLRLGFRRVLTSDSLSASVGAAVTYHTARGKPGGRVEVLLPMGNRYHLRARGGRETLTMDRWIRGDLANSAAALFLRSDIRNYFESDYIALRGWRDLPQSPKAGKVWLAPHLEVRASRDRSLASRDPWSVLGSAPWRDNPPVSDGTLTSVLPGFAAAWQGVSSRFTSDVTLEWAFPSPVQRSPEREFLQLVGDGRWEMITFGVQTLAIRSRVTKALTGTSPEQRWGLLGGSGTLPTLPAGSLRGDDLVFVESTYVIPLPFVTVPLAGDPAVLLSHAIGNAWVSGASGGPWTQNIGAGLRFNVLTAMLYADPAEGPGSATFSLSLGVPF